MKSKILGLLAVGLLAGPIAAMAAPVTWDFTGTWTNVDGSAQEGFSPLPAIGDPFGISVTFDSSAPATNVCNGASSSDECNRYSAASLQFVLSSPSCTDGVCASAGPTGNISGILVQNNNTGVDALTFRLYDSSGALWRLIFQTDNLDVLSGTALPTTFDPRFLLVYSQFTLCDPNPAGTGCGEGWTTRVTGFQTLALASVADVPEPGTLALLGLGLAGLGLSRRRKA